MEELEPLTLERLKSNAALFVAEMNRSEIPSLYGTTDGKAVGTHVEHEFHEFLLRHFTYPSGNSASGIDFPSLAVDLKVTSYRQPQSSCPFHAASQKVYGLGYHLIVFVYEKVDDDAARSARLNFQQAVFIDSGRTADYQTTKGLLGILERDGNQEDVEAFLRERNLPLDEIGFQELAGRIIDRPPELGVLTVSNALQWRLQYGRALAHAAEASTPGVDNLLALAEKLE